MLVGIGNLQDGIAVEVGVTDHFDLDGDSTIDVVDLDAWLTSAAGRNGFTESYLPGDADLDGAVHAADLNALALNWRQDVTGWSGGDFFVDGMVDARDLNALAVNWRSQIDGPEPATVPEPGALWMAVVSLVGLAGLRPLSSLPPR